MCYHPYTRLESSPIINPPICLLVINKSLDVLMDNSSYILIPNQSRIIIMVASKNYGKGIIFCHMATNGICSLKTCHSYCSINRGIVSLIPNVINFGGAVIIFMILVSSPRINSKPLINTCKLIS
jgi:hypothetical protein